MSLNGLNIVNGEFDMMKYMSVSLKLDDVVLNEKIEKKVIDKLLECKKLSGNLFKVVFFHTKMKQKECKDFVKRNQDNLFELGTDITKSSKDTWLLIDSKNERSRGRYRYEGDILRGIVQYIEIINHMKKRDNGRR